MFALHRAHSELRRPAASPGHGPLRTGGAPWDLDRPEQTFGLATTKATDVLVIGAGISGALMAYRLAQSGLRVLVLDRSMPASGSTAASTALLQFELDLPLFLLRDRLGVELADRAWRRSADALQSLSRIIRQERFRCGFRPRTSLYLAGAEYDGDALRREHDARRDAGLPAELLGRSEVRDAFQLDRAAAIVTAGAAAVNPVQLTLSLLAAACAAGAQVATPADVQHVHEADGGIRAEVVGADGSPLQVEARAAVYCTGYRLPELTTWTDHQIVSTWAIAATAVPSPPEWVRTHVMWEGDSPYHYLRSLNTNSVIIGGGDEPSGSAFQDRGLLQSKASMLLETLRHLLPAHRFRLTHAWAGAFGSSTTGLPFIGRLPGYERVFSVHGFGGNGITHSMLAADLVTSELLGQPDPDARIFNGAASSHDAAIAR